MKVLLTERTHVERSLLTGNHSFYIGDRGFRLTPDVDTR